MAQSGNNNEFIQNVEDFMNSNRSKNSSKVSNSTTKDNENYDDEPDETIGERLWGLTEMFPQPVRNITGTAVCLTVKGVKCLYKFSCNASWIFFTSSVILFAPVVFETERAQIKELQRTQQRQILLGPGAAMAATGGPKTEKALR